MPKQLSSLFQKKTFNPNAEADPELKFAATDDATDDDPELVYEPVCRPDYRLVRRPSYEPDCVMADRFKHLMNYLLRHPMSIGELSVCWCYYENRSWLDLLTTNKFNVTTFVSQESREIVINEPREIVINEDTIENVLFIFELTDFDYYQHTCPEDYYFILQLTNGLYVFVSCYANANWGNYDCSVYDCGDYDCCVYYNEDLYNLIIYEMGEYKRDVIYSSLEQNICNMVAIEELNELIPVSNLVDLVSDYL